MSEADKTDQELMQAAFSALLRGDTDERDRICAVLEARQIERKAEAVKWAQAASPHLRKH